MTCEECQDCTCSDPNKFADPDPAHRSAIKVITAITTERMSTIVHDLIVGLEAAGIEPCKWDVIQIVAEATSCAIDNLDMLPEEEKVGQDEGDENDSTDAHADSALGEQPSDVCTSAPSMRHLVSAQNDADDPNKPPPPTVR